jgi:purine-binding chemotaxis protein CheW
VTRVRARTKAGVIDWAEIRRRVDAAALAAGGAAVTPERSRELLEARARALAAPEEAPSADDVTLELLTFSLGNEVFAVETRHVMGVVPLTNAAPLPGAAAPVWGLTVWRGDLLTVLDLRPEVGVAAATLEEPAWVIVLGGDQQPSFGLLVTSAREVVRLSAAELAPPAAAGAGGKYVRGISREAVVLLDGDELLRAHGTTDGATN